jgi:hypothetical protein
MKTATISRRVCIVAVVAAACMSASCSLPRSTTDELDALTGDHPNEFVPWTPVWIMGASKWPSGFSVDPAFAMCMPDLYCRLAPAGPEAG